MTLPRAIGRRESAMAEEFENYEVRLAEARRAVERWETEGGARETEQSLKRTPEATPGSKPSIPPVKSGGWKHRLAIRERGKG